MRHAANLVCLLLVLVAVAPARGQEATPGATPSSASSVIRVRLDRVALDGAATIGITRTTVAVGGGFRLAAGAGPAVMTIEAGELIVEQADASVRPIIVRPGAANGAPVESVTLLSPGDALLVPIGVGVKFRNSGDSPAVVLELVAASDTQSSDETGVTRAVMVRLRVTLPPPPLDLTQSRATIAPGARFAFPPAPAQTVLATVERSQTFLLTGQGVNLGARPMEVYVLTLAPAAD